jgi:hypothetical protein
MRWNIRFSGGITSVSLFCDAERAGGVIFVVVTCADCAVGGGTTATRPTGVMLRSKLDRFKAEGTGIGVLECFTGGTTTRTWLATLDKKDSNWLPDPCCEVFGVKSFEAWVETFDTEALGVADFVGGKILVGGLIGVSLRSWRLKETFLFIFAGNGIWASIPTPRDTSGELGDELATA